VPQPDIGVGDLAHLFGNRVGGCSFDHLFDLLHDFGHMAGCTHPLNRFDPTAVVNVHVQDTHSFQQGGQAAFEDLLAVACIEVTGCVFAVVPCCTRG
jgi:hypothetical protein